MLRDSVDRFLLALSGTTVQVQRKERDALCEHAASAGSFISFPDPIRCSHVWQSPGCNKHFLLDLLNRTFSGLLALGFQDSTDTGLLPDRKGQSSVNY